MKHTKAEKNTKQKQNKSTQGTVARSCKVHFFGGGDSFGKPKQLLLVWARRLRQSHCDIRSVQNCPKSNQRVCDQILWIQRFLFYFFVCMENLFSTS